MPASIRPASIPWILLLSACALPVHPNYIMRLSSVQRPLSARDRYGPEHLAVISDSGKTKFTFDDSLVQVTVAPTDEGFAFRLDNKTDHSIRLVWDDAAIVPPTGESQRILHAGVKYVDRNDSQPPSVIVAHGYIDDVAVPTANVSLATGRGGGWTTSPFLPRPRFTSKTRVAALSSLKSIYQGREIKLLLPLQIEGYTNDYLFTFTIIDVRGDDVIEAAAGVERGASVPTAPSKPPTPKAAPVSTAPAGGSAKVAPTAAPPKTGAGSADKLPSPTSPSKSAVPSSDPHPNWSTSIIGTPSSDEARTAALYAFAAAESYMGRHEWSKAEESFRAALQFDGSVAKYHAALGSLLMTQKRWAEAQAEFSAAVLLDVDNVDYRQKLKQARASQ
jgi:hypothetical protein